MRGLAARYSVFVMPVCQETPVRLVVAGCRCAGALTHTGVVVAFNRSGQLIDGCIPPLAVLVILVYPLRQRCGPSKATGDHLCTMVALSVPHYSGAVHSASWLHSAFRETWWRNASQSKQKQQVVEQNGNQTAYYPVLSCMLAASCLPCCNGCCNVDA